MVEIIWFSIERNGKLVKPKSKYPNSYIYLTRPLLVLMKLVTMDLGKDGKPFLVIFKVNFDFAIGMGKGSRLDLVARDDKGILDLREVEANAFG